MHRLMLTALSFEVRDREILCVSGVSGAGKSVLLRAIADLDPNRGEAECDGVRRSSVPAPAWRSRVGYVPAEPGWWSPAVAEHFTDLAEARKLAVRLGIDPTVFGRPVALASTGERQRLALVRALLRKPRALLLDEPTSALDRSSRTAVEALLREVAASGVSIVVVSHDTAQVERLGARSLELRAGALV